VQDLLSGDQETSSKTNIDPEGVLGPL